MGKEVIKMGKYGEASIFATMLVFKGEKLSPVEAWKEAVKKVFPNSNSSQNKGCPKDTFLGLCEEGYITNINRGSYTKSKKNKKYGLQAIKVLDKNPSMSKDEKALWDLIMNGETKTPNHQMDVVCSLWNADLIKKPTLF
jgi:hypothetical protein